MGLQQPNDVAAFTTAPSLGSAFVGGLARTSTLSSSSSTSSLHASSVPWNQASLIAKSKEMRLQHLEEQAMFALKTSIQYSKKPVFPNALIAGDCVITHMLHRLGYFKGTNPDDPGKKVGILVVDTFHLFPETITFLKDVEKHYGFKSEVYCASGVPAFDKAAFDSKYSPTLWKEDIQQYDKVCKVEPFQRGLKELAADCMINGRTRWQGIERAWIDQFEEAPVLGGMAKCNPIAYWTLEDTFDYIRKYSVPHHPLHAKGYPSIGDWKDTVPIPADGSVIFENGNFKGDWKQWLDYAQERKGRFVGLPPNKDGSAKSECGIHVVGAEKTWDRDLWPSDTGSKVTDVKTEKEMEDIMNGKEAGVVVVYAPWCKFCKAMEAEYDKFAAEMAKTGTKVYKFRGDERRDFVGAKMNTMSFPTVNYFKAGKVTKYESEARKVEDFTAFFNKQ